MSDDTMAAEREVLAEVKRYLDRSKRRRQARLRAIDHVRYSGVLLTDRLSAEATRCAAEIQVLRVAWDWVHSLEKKRGLR